MQQHKTESEFLKELEGRASEEKMLLKTRIMPGWAKRLGDWLVVNPWRVLVPVASIMYLVLRIMYGQQLRELILGIFGGF
ncbi:MAG: hypothetical protein V1487_04615 [bacterium]